MNVITRKFNATVFLLFITLAGLLLMSGCARYARNTDVLYESSVYLHGGSGDVYIIIPEYQRTQSSAIKWVLGNVKDDENNKIDEVFSPRSPAEIIQTALAQELTKAGYTAIATTKNPGDKERVITLTRTEINLEQISDFADLKATCRIVLGVEVLKNSQLTKRVQYQSTSSKTDVKDRDLLARSTLHDALQSIMQQAVPDLHNLFTR